MQKALFQFKFSVPCSFICWNMYLYFAFTFHTFRSSYCFIPLVNCYLSSYAIFLFHSIRPSLSDFPTFLYCSLTSKSPCKFCLHSLVSYLSLSSLQNMWTLYTHTYNTYTYIGILNIRIYGHTEIRECMCSVYLLFGHVYYFIGCCCWCHRRCRYCCWIAYDVFVIFFFVLLFFLSFSRAHTHTIVLALSYCVSLSSLILLSLHLFLVIFVIIFYPIGISVSFPYIQAQTNTHSHYFCGKFWLSAIHIIIHVSVTFMRTYKWLP